MITKRLNATQYVHLCKDKAGKWHKGETKTYQKVLKGKK